MTSNSELPAANIRPMPATGDPIIEILQRATPKHPSLAVRHCGAPSPQRPMLVGLPRGAEGAARGVCVCVPLGGMGVVRWIWLCPPGLLCARRPPG